MEGITDREDLVPRFLVGEHVYLRPLDAGDLTAIQKWANDPEIRGLTGQVRPMSRVKAEAFYERVKGDEHPGGAPPKYGGYRAG
ncbi:MAG: hypothetical protein PVG25_06095 [Anaerolineae bacterium]|jgi:hypothetical protein